jgi:hypothetical protein
MSNAVDRVMAAFAKTHVMTPEQAQLVRVEIVAIIEELRKRPPTVNSIVR